MTPTASGLVLGFLLAFVRVESSLQFLVDVGFGERVEYPNIEECHRPILPESSSCYIQSCLNVLIC